MRIKIISICMVMLFLSTTEAQSVDIRDAVKAQGDMLERISTHNNLWLNILSLGQEYKIYCEQELSLRKYGFPSDGSIPFGVNYNNLDKAQLELTISVRETYEKAFVRLCLMKIKQLSLDVL